MACARLPVARALLLLAMTGCATRDRLLRMSPFGDGPPPSPDRVNFWPLLYHDHDRTSVLWPLIDFDDHGWSFRPFVSKDDDKLDVLWPLSSFDFAKGEYQVLTAWMDQKSFACVPLWYWNREDGTWQVLLAYHGTESAGVFPLVGWGALDYVGPFWRYGSKERQFEFGGVFPLLWTGRDLDSLVVFPLYWQFGHGDRFTLFNLVPPVWHSHDRAAGQITTTIFPLFHHAQDGAHQRVLTPLGGRSWDAAGDDGFVNVLGPLFHYDREGDETLTTFLWPIFELETRPVGTTWRVWPLIAHSPLKDDASFLDRATLIDHRSDDVSTAFRLFPIFSTTPRRGTNDWLDAITLIGWHPHPDKTHLHVGTSMAFGFDSWGESRDSYRVRVLGANSAGQTTTTVKTPKGDRKVVRTFAGSAFEWALHEKKEITEPDGTRRVESHHRVPLLFESKSDADSSEWDFLLWCVASKETKDESRFQLLWRLYASERHGDRVSRDLFPFVTWDSAPDESHFSFLWRLFQYQHKGDRSGGHVLFTPWGDTSD